MPCIRSGTTSRSWCINPKDRGGRELPAKVVQELLGHSSIVMTLDLYGHLFPRGDDRAELGGGRNGDVCLTRHKRDNGRIS